MADEASAPEVDVFHWNPRRPLSPRRGLRRIPGRRPNNFGDMLGPPIVERLARLRGRNPERPAADVRLLSVGSVMHFARPGRTVAWGTGINGKVTMDPALLVGLDVRAVRGPATRERLLELGVPAVPAVFGDPALLLPSLCPELAPQGPRLGVTIVPNLNDRQRYHGHRVLDPRTTWRACVRRIAASELVVGSSLHAIIVAEAFGVPARLVVSGAEPAFKYEDYYRGTGRATFDPAPTVEAAIEAGGEPPIAWDAGPLRDAFPGDLWAPSVDDAGAKG